MQCDKDTVWVRTYKGGASYGTSKHARSDIEASLTAKRIALADQKAVVGDPVPQKRADASSGARSGGLPAAPPKAPPSGPETPATGSGAPATAATAPPATSADGIQVWWSKLQTWGKAAVIGVPLAILLLLLLVLPAACSDPAVDQCVKSVAAATKELHPDLDSIRATCQKMKELSK